MDKPKGGVGVSQVVKRTMLSLIGIGLMAAVVGDWALHHRLERRYQTALAARRQLELQLGELRADREQVSAKLVEAQQRVSQLSEALSSRDEALQHAMSRLTEEERTIQELRENLVATQRQFDLLQGELAMALQRSTAISTPATPKTVQLEKVIVTPAPSSGGGIQGRVVSVHPEWKFVVVDLGWSTVNIGDVVSIYRNEQFLAKARIERVQEQVCAATLLPEWSETEIEINDVVRIL